MLSMNTDINKLNKYIKYFAGFSAVGVVITILSLLAIIFFVEFIKIDLLISYPIVYACSILASYYLNKDFVFKYKGNKNRLILYFMIYLTSMFIGMFLIYIIKKLMSMPESVIAIMILPLTTIYNFLLVYLIFKNDSVI